jgi:PAS domain S-box-containing protein
VRIPPPPRPESGTLLLGLAIAGLVFIGDLFVPNGVAFGVSYTLATLATLSSPQRRVTIIVTIVASLLAILGVFLGAADDPTPFSLVMTNRALALGVIWAITLIIVQHKKTARALQLNQQHEAAISESIQTGFVEMDAEGKITGWNRHAEEIFGWSRDEALGRVLADTVIPEAFREGYQRGLQRYLATGEAKLLNKWIELEGLRRDGSTFPLELFLGVRQRASGEPGFFGFLQDNTERQRADRELRESHHISADLAGRLISSHEDERRRLARHLHDDFSQRVAIWTMELAQVEQAMPGDVHPGLHNLQEQAEELARDLHELSHRLHPAVLEQLGFVTGVRNECDRFQELEGIEVSFHSDITEEVPLEIALAMYRVVQEGLRNVARHAQARRVTVWLTCRGGRVHASITDDGVGFEAGRGDERTHLGLLSMNERARAVGGSCSVTSEPGHGTCVEIEAPLPAPKEPPPGD